MSGNWTCPRSGDKNLDLGQGRGNGTARFPRKEARRYYMGRVEDAK